MIRMILNSSHKLPETMSNYIVKYPHFSAVLYANRAYLRLYRTRYAARLRVAGAQIVGDVFIDPSAEVR